jgi:hypothetical protein
VRHRRWQSRSEAARLPERCERTALFRDFNAEKPTLSEVPGQQHMLALNKIAPIFKSGSWTHTACPKQLCIPASCGALIGDRLHGPLWRIAQPLICNDRLFAVRPKLWQAVGHSVFQGTSLAGQPGSWSICKLDSSRGSCAVFPLLRDV